MQNPTRSAWEELPNELSLSIFQQCLLDPAIIPPPPHDTRFRLMATCREWQTLIESTPQFWDDVVFLPVGSNPAQLEHLADVWLHRTRAVQVSITFNNEYALYHEGRRPTYAQQHIYGNGAFCAIQLIILPCVTRITYLSCTLGTDQTIRTFFNMPPERFLSLQRIEMVLVNELNRYSSSFDPGEYTGFTVFRNLPLLRQVTVQILNAMHPYHLGLPWRQLTDLDLGSAAMPVNVFLEIIETTKYSLKNGSFQVKLINQSIPRFELPLSHGPVVAYSLESLHLIVIDPSQDYRLFYALHLPAVTFLQIEVEDAKNSWNLGIYLPMLKNTPSMKRISISSFCSSLRIHPDMSIFRHKLVPDDVMEAFFSAIPTIRNLVFGLGLHIHPPTLHKLARGELLPKLETLECGSLSGLQILSMVRQRNESAEYSSQSLPAASSSQLRSQEISGHSSIVSLKLYVPQDDLADISAEVKKLCQCRSIATAKIDVKGSDRRLYYYVA